MQTNNKNNNKNTAVIDRHVVQIVTHHHHLHEMRLTGRKTGGLISQTSTRESEMSPTSPGIQEAMRVLANDYDLPGPFTVLQGMAGDGMANTIDTLPDVIIDRHDQDTGSIITEAIVRPPNEDSACSHSNGAEQNLNAPDGDPFSIAGSMSETSSLELVTHSQASMSSYNPNDQAEREMTSTSETEQQKKTPCLSPRRDDQPATGLHLPLPPGIPLNGYNSILPQVGIHLLPLSPIRNDSFIMIDGKRSASNDVAVSDDSNSVSSEISESRIDIGRRSPHNSKYGTISAENRDAIKQWNKHCREKEKMQRDEVLTHLTSSGLSGASSLYQNQWWKSKRHCLCVFDSLPECISSLDNVGTLKHAVRAGNVIGEVTPGSTVMGLEKFIIEIPNKTPSKNPREGLVEVLKIESPMIGYVVYSVDGYPFIGPGLPSSYSEPDMWLWKVTCTNGAYVRQGLELMSVHVDTIPFGSFVRVKRKTINAMGLTRLQIEAFVPKKSDPTVGISNALRSLSLLRRNPNHDTASKMNKIVGWVSEVLNPLSGQTGPIVKPVPLPVPVQFRIRLPDGAVIRQQIELSSNQIGHAPMGTIVTCVRQAYSQNPTDRCIQRLQLAGGGGWVSVKLNRPPPSDQISVLEQIDIDGSFGPDEAGLFHIERQLMVIHEYNTNITSPNEEDRLHIANVRRSLRRLGSCVSSIHDDNEGEENSAESSEDTGVVCSSAVPALYRSGIANVGRISSQVTLKCGSKTQQDDPCLICLSEERNATIVHGETGHIACCLTCARLLKGRGDKCPVCRLPIDLIIQQFWA